MVQLIHYHGGYCYELNFNYTSTMVELITLLLPKLWENVQLGINVQFALNFQIMYHFNPNSDTVNLTRLYGI